MLVSNSVKLTGAMTLDNNSDGRLDGARLIFNQSFNRSAFDTRSLSIAGRTNLTTSSSGTGSTIDVTFDESTGSYDTAYTPVVTITQSYTGSDAVTYFGSGGVTSSDAAKPVLIQSNS